jgi:hypothetical protein
MAVPDTRNLASSVGKVWFKSSHISDAESSSKATASLGSGNHADKSIHATQQQVLRFAQDDNFGRRSWGRDC